MKRNKPPEVKTGKMVRKRKTIKEINGTAFVWCNKDGQYQHYLVCRKKCKDCDCCTSFMKYISGEGKKK